MQHAPRSVISFAALALLAACAAFGTPATTTTPEPAASTSEPELGLPTINGTCPNDLSLHADAHGPVYFNGQEAALTKVSDTSYEASRDGVTVTLSVNPDGTVSATYAGPDGVNGICTVAG